MTKQLEALIAEMKAAAEKATPGEWIAFADEKTGTCAIHTPSDKGCGDIVDWPGFDSSRVSKKKRIANAKHIALSNPKNIKALIAALEQAQRSNAFLKEQLAQLANFNPDWDKLEACQRSWLEVGAELKAAEKRIAELEASPLAVKRPGTKFLGWVKESIHEHDDKWIKAIRAAGGTVEGE